MTLGEIQARIFYHRQALITPIAYQICSQQVRKPDDKTPLAQPYDLFPHLIEPPPKLKEVDPRTLSKTQRQIMRLEQQLEAKMITPQDFQREMNKLSNGI